MPTVSVIMPAFNSAAYIDAAMASVLNQTVSDVELLVIDDGSTDETAAMVARRRDADPRVRLLRQPNAGPGAARNAGFREARGQFFAFLDSDDEWAPTFVERQLAILAARPDVAVVFGNAWYRGGPRQGQPARRVDPDDRTLRLADILADDNLHFIMALFRRSVVDTVGGFNPMFVTNEEYEMWLRAAVAGFTFARNSEPLGWYRCRPDSLSASEVRMLQGALRVLEHTRPKLEVGSREQTLLDRAAVRYDARLAVAETREMLAGGDKRAVRRHLTALHERRGGWLLGLAARLPRAAIAAYGIREALRNQLRLRSRRWAGRSAA
jgi:glycosyltransferase involved in cell wall biosynthesis